MEGKLGNTTRKRPFFEDDFGDEGDSSKPSKQKKVRFPKGKKVKAGNEAEAFKGEPNLDLESQPATDPRHAAVERAKRRNKLHAEIFSGQVNDMGTAEVAYEDNDNFDEDGIEVEPFNLDKEREEGYFDAAGNFVEFVNDNEYRDPWLESLEFEKYEPKNGKKPVLEDTDAGDTDVLSSEDVGNIKRRIADVLLPGETVLQALRRLKGTSDGKKQKMSAETQHVFDQLTEDANKLLDEGEYNVYQEKQEVFRREAEGYERLARAKDSDPQEHPKQEESGFDIFADESYNQPSSSMSSLPKAEVSRDESEPYDIFAEDEDVSAAKHSNTTIGSASDVISDSRNEQPLETKDGDYVYDEASGYYYSSTSGYYYDPSSGYYCNATSGQWYSYNEDSKTYEEVLQSSS